MGIVKLPLFAWLIVDLKGILKRNVRCGCVLVQVFFITL